MKKNIYLIFFLWVGNFLIGQVTGHFTGVYLLENGLDSVSLTINNDGTFKTVSTSMCHGNDILRSEGKWKSNGDTVALITDSRSKTGEKAKVYVYKPQSVHVLKRDSLLLLDDKKLPKPKFSYRKLNSTEEINVRGKRNSTENKLQPADTSKIITGGLPVIYTEPRNVTSAYIDGKKVFFNKGTAFAGTSLNKNYKCWLKIYEDSTITYIYQNYRKYDFGEFHGRIQRLNDTAFRLKCVMALGQIINKMLSDTPNVYVNKNARKFDTLIVHYRKGPPKIFSIGDTTQLIALSIQKFGSYRTNDSLTLTINRKNLITNEPLKFIIPFGSSAELIAEEKEEFDIIIKNNRIKTIGKAPMQIGHFTMIKMK